MKKINFSFNSYLYLAFKYYNCLKVKLINFFLLKNGNFN